MILLAMSLCDRYLLVLHNYVGIGPSDFWSMQHLDVQLEVHVACPQDLAVTLGTCGVYIWQAIAASRSCPSMLIFRCAPFPGCKVCHLLIQVLFGRRWAVLREEKACFHERCLWVGLSCFLFSIWDCLQLQKLFTSAASGAGDLCKVQQSITTSS